MKMSSARKPKSAGPGPWPARRRRPSAARRARSRTRTAACRRSRRVRRGGPSSGPAGPGRTGVDTTGLARRRLGHRGPGRTAEGADPVVRGLLAMLTPAVAEVVAARSSLSGPAASAAVNDGCSSEVWFATKSTITFRPAHAPRPAAPARRPGCRTAARCRCSRSRVPAVLHRRGVPRGDPQPIDSQVAQVGQPGAEIGRSPIPSPVPSAKRRR